MAVSVPVNCPGHPTGNTFCSHLLVQAQKKWRLLFLKRLELDAALDNLSNFQWTVPSLLHRSAHVLPVVNGRDQNEIWFYLSSRWNVERRHTGVPFHLAGSELMEMENSLHFIKSFIAVLAGAQPCIVLSHNNIISDSLTHTTAHYP